MIKTVYIAHGYRSRRHVEWVEDARSRFEAANMPVQPVNYGFTRIWNVRRRTISQAERLAAVCLTPSVGIGHSNGCELLLRAATKGAALNHLLFINPALKPDITIPAHVDYLDVFYAPDDMAVVAGKWWRRMNPAHLFTKQRSLWGTMGREGYAEGRDPRVRNWSLGRVGHGGALDWDRGAVLWNLLTDLILTPEDASIVPIPVFPA